MKTTTIITLLLLVLNSTAFTQDLPDKKTTQNYIKKIFDDTYDFDEVCQNGTIFKITSAPMPNYYNWVSYELIFYSNGTSKLSFVRKSSGVPCSYGYRYTDINWAKLQSIQDYEGFPNNPVRDNSSVKFLRLNFLPNSVLRTGYVGHAGQNCHSEEGFSNSINSEPEPVSYILFPYKNEEGLVKKLVRALYHLGKLEKEEQTSNDPFAE